VSQTGCVTDQSTADFPEPDVASMFVIALIVALLLGMGPRRAAKLVARIDAAFMFLFRLGKLEPIRHRRTRAGVARSLKGAHALWRTVRPHVGEVNRNVLTKLRRRA
jgi:hypothetical protein